MVDFIKGQVFGDKDDLSKNLRKKLWSPGIQLITQVRCKMKSIKLENLSQLVLRKRSLMEMVQEQFKKFSPL